MKVIICGAGQVGWQIARHLASEKNDVTIVDSDQDLVERAKDTLDVKGVSGFASYPNVLSSGGAEDADMIIAATHSDEVNMVTCQVAHSIFNIPRKIARLRSQSYLDAIYADLYRRDHLPIDVVISPELEVAEAALKRLSFPNAFESENFLNNQAQLLGLHIEENCPVVNTPLRQLTDLFSTLRVIVVGVRRHGLLFAPSAGDQLFCSDQVYLMCHTSDASRTMDVFGKSQGEQNRIILIGGGNVGLRIAKTLEESKHRVRSKIIEKNRAQAEFSAGSLERTIVLHGDGLDSGLLDEANVSKTDAILDLGLSKLEHREKFRKFAYLNNYELTTHFLDISKDTRMKRVLKRNLEKGDTFEFEVRKEDFDFMENWFEKPTEKEMIGGIIITE